MAPEPTLSLTQFGVIFNVVGIAIALVASMAIALHHGRPFFWAWTWHYLFTLGTLVTELLTTPFGHIAGLAVPELALYMAATHCLFLTSFGMRDRRPPRWYVPAMAGTALLSLAFIAAGVAFQEALLPALLASLVAHVTVGVTLLRAGGPTATALGWLVLALSAWFMGYPLMVGTPILWLGFTVCGLFHIFVGVGMIIYLLDSIADQVRRQHEALQQVDRLKTNFLATMSHELRTPLTVIMGSGLLLREGAAGPLNNKQAPLVADLCDQGDQLIKLIDDLLDFSRMEVGAMRYHHRLESLNDLVRGTAESLRPTLERAGLTLAVEVPEAPLEAPVDGLKFAQVLVNLLTNAAKFTPAGHITVRLARDGEAACLSVADCGIGIAPDEHDRIFDKFYQVDGGPTRKVGGTGLGLAICKAIVEEGHDGRIWVESTPGAGSTFHVQVPLNPR